MNSVELAIINRISTLATNNPMRFMLFFPSRSAALALAAAATVARAGIGAGRRRHRGFAAGRRGGSGSGTWHAGLLHQLVQRQVQEVRAVVAVDHHLADAGVH